MIKLGVLLALAFVASTHSIDDFGAVPNDSSTKAALNNKNAMLKAIDAAMADKTDRTVEVPFGKNRERNEYWMLEVAAFNLTDITFEINGEIVFPDDQTLYPHFGNSYSDLIYLENCKNIHFKGSGSLEGQGYWWWVNEFLGKNKYGRPHLVHVNTCENF